MLHRHHIQFVRISPRLVPVLVPVLVSPLVASNAVHAGGYVNLAEGRDVALIAGTASGAALSTLTDGLFLAQGTQWQANTVWWHGTGSMFEIDLDGVFEVGGAIVQADNNDTYRMLYHDLATDSFVDMWTIAAVGGAGMRTRPNPGDNTEIHYLPTTVMTDAIRISAIGGDSSYSLSEVQVWGTVPAPAAGPLLAIAGLLRRGGRRRD